MHAITASVRTERRKDTACERKSGNTGSQAAKSLLVQTEVALVSTQHWQCELSNVSQDVLFFDYDFAHINSQHKTTWLIHVLFLPRTLPHIHATRAVCVFLFNSVGVLLLVTEAVAPGIATVATTKSRNEVRGRHLHVSLQVMLKTQRQWSHAPTRDIMDYIHTQTPDVQWC